MRWIAVIALVMLGLAVVAGVDLAYYRTGNLAEIWLFRSAGTGGCMKNLTVAPHEPVDVHFDVADWDGVAAIVVTDNGAIIQEDHDLATTASGGVIRRYAAARPGQHRFQVTGTDKHGRQRQGVATLTVAEPVADPP